MVFKDKFLDKWNEKDELCPHCNNVTRRAIGINKQNLKRLCLSKPTMMDWAMLVVWISALIIAYRYNIEVGQCQDFLEQNRVMLTTLRYPYESDINPTEIRDTLTDLLASQNLSTNNSLEIYSSNPFNYSLEDEVQ